MNSRAAARSSSTRAQALEQGRESFRNQVVGSRLFSAVGGGPRGAARGRGSRTACAGRPVDREERRRERTFCPARTRPSSSRGDAQPAARCAFWLGFTATAQRRIRTGRRLAFAGQHGCSMASPTAWKTDTCCCRTGYRAFHAGDTVTAQAIFAQAAAIRGAFRRQRT